MKVTQKRFAVILISRKNTFKAQKGKQHNTISTKIITYDRKLDNAA
jgi:hypothetical protein